MYRLDEKTGEQHRCDAGGVIIRPFNPKITGRFNYDERQKAILRSKADLAPVELPITLKSSLNRVYAPQNQLLQGYAQMPRMIVPPYTN